MTLLHVVSYVAVVVTLLFVTLSLASGLLWLAEVIEEHSRTAKIVGKRTVYAVIVFHLLLYTYDANLPLSHIAFSIACHLVYLLNFSNFPLIDLASWSFIVSCLMVVADHFLWFFHFHAVLEDARIRERRWRHPMEPLSHVPTFLDISTFFGICVWLVPLFLFLSLSANDNALPTASHYDSNITLMSASDTSQPKPEKPQRSSLFVSLSSKATSFFPSQSLLRSLSGRNSDGLITPRSTSRPTSPLQQSSGLLSPAFRGRPTSPILMHPPSPLQSPIASPSAFGQGSWSQLDGLSLSPGTDGNAARRRPNLQPPPPRRAASYVK